MKILSLNPGSSSLKYGLFEFANSKSKAHELLRGKIEIRADISFELAIKSVFAHQVLRDPKLHLDAIACRVVHGGSIFSEPTLMRSESIKKLLELSELAPLHNPNSLAIINLMQAMYPQIAVYAVFDSAFHKTLPAHAYTYALPTNLADKITIRRFGFHGISHRYIARCIQQLSEDSDRLISCHLGNGASVCAMRAGVSVDTSMGFTPLEGLVMGTRCGDVDAGIILYLLNHCGKTSQQIDEILNSQSGLMALAGESDVRSIEQRATSGDQNATLALRILSYRLAKYIAAYTVALQGLDVIAFSGGIGENSNMVRQEVCNQLSFMGVDVCAQSELSTAARKISTASSKIAVWVVPTDEELQLAIETAQFLEEH